MKDLNLFYLSIMGTFLLVLAPVSAFGQVNSTSTTSASSAQEFPLRGLYHLLYTESAKSIAGKSINDFYVYNIVEHKLTFVDLDSKTIKTKSLSSSEADDLDSVFYRDNIPDNLSRINGPPCPECTQYGLSFHFVDLEKLVPRAGSVFWDGGTKGTEDLKNLTTLIVKLSK